MEDKAKNLVMIVDDVAKNLQVLAAVLYQQGYEIAMADSGAFALEMLKELKPDLILLDVMMPEMDGFEVCKSIKSNGLLDEIPIIFLTAKHETESIVKGFELGAADYVTKPFNSSELISRVNTHIELRRQRERLNELNKNLEEKVKERTAELEQAYSRLAKLDTSKSYFLSLLSHELNTPINGIRGFTRLLESTLTDEEDLEAVHYISDSTDRLKRFADLSLLLTSLKSERYAIIRESLTVEDMLDEVIFKHEPDVHKKNIEIIKDYHKSCPNIEADTRLLTECFDILFSNSVKFTQTGGSVRVATDHDDSRVYINFTDSGQGFTEDSLDNLYELFSSDEILHHKEGFGLGLATAKIIIDNHGGEIKAENLPGGGAQVSVSFKIV